MAFKGLVFVVHGDDPTDHYARNVEWYDTIAGEEGVVEWVNPEDLPLESDHDPHTVVHVLDTFETSALSTLIESCVEGERIVGPDCIIQCLRDGIELPRNPTFNTCLQGVRVSCTGLHPDDKVRVQNLVRWMNGTVEATLHRECSYLIAGTSTSKKARIARKWNKAVLQFSFIQTIWDESILNGGNCPHETLDNLLYEYTLPPIFGVHISVTGLSHTERLKVKAQTEAMGGIYSGDLTKDCTQLLAPESDTSAKQRFAFQNGIPVVSLAWFHRCIQGNRYVDHEPFILGQKCDDSWIGAPKPLSLADSSTFSRLNVPLISPCKRKAQGIDTDDDIVVRRAKRDNAQSRQRLLESRESSKRSASHIEATDNSSFCRTINHEDLVHATKTESHCTTDNETMCLRGTYVYFSGFHDQQRQLNLRKMLVTNAGTRLSRLSNTVTHVVLGGLEKADLRQLVAMEDPPHIVTPAWLVHCHLEKRCVSTVVYELRLSASEGSAAVEVSGSSTCTDVPDHVKILHSDTGDCDIETDEVIMTKMCEEYEEF
eukprot:CFRG6168T1